MVEYVKGWSNIHEALRAWEASLQASAEARAYVADIAANTLEIGYKLGQDKCACLSLPKDERSLCQSQVDLLMSELRPLLAHIFPGRLR